MQAEIVPQTVPQVLTEIRDGHGLNLATVAKQLPGNSESGHVNPSTAWRWAKTGCRLPDGRRVFLEVVKIGSRWLTSKQAVDRFIVALTDANQTDPIPTPRSRRTTRTRGQAANDRLKSRGY